MVRRTGSCSSSTSTPRTRPRGATCPTSPSSVSTRCAGGTACTRLTPLSLLTLFTLLYSTLVREWYRMYKTAEGKGENKYGLDGSAARSKCLPWQWCLARLLLCLLGAHLAAPGSLALPLGSAHPLGAQPLPGVLELLTYDPSTLLTLNYRPRRGRGARAQGGGAHAHLLGEHDGEGRQGHRRRRLRLRQARRVLDQALRAEGRAVEMRVARSCS
eukprot:scaffold58698_cov70-Phaeocystis_antarctica.AAC.3